MRNKIDVYLKNFNKVIALDDMTDFHLLNKDELFNVLKQNAVTKQAIAEENNVIIKEILQPLEKKKELTQEEREDIEYFVMHLKHGFESLDNGMLYRLYKILLDDAMLKQDKNQIVTYIYFFSYYEYILQSTFPRGERSCSWDLIDNYIDDYDTLSVEAKKYFLRCYGNKMLSKDYSYESQKKIYDFIAKKKDLEPDLDIPYDAYLLSVDKNICNGIEIIRHYDETNTKAPQELIDGVYESAYRVHNNIRNVKNTSLPVKQIYEYIYSATQFHKGLITIDELLKIIKDLSKIKEEYTIQEKSSSIIRMNMNYIRYMNYKNFNEKEQEQIISKAVQEVMDFVHTLKPSDYTRNMNADLLAFLQVAATYYRYDGLEELFIKTTTRRHTPTLIHSMSVAGISKILTEAMLEKKPEFFVAVIDNYDLNYIHKHHDEILDMSYRMGMMHDIGKFYCIPFISVNHRRLFQAEFEVIKRHPVYGYNLVKQAISKPILDAILLHHSWHNHKGGYPLNPEKTENQPLVDILAIADCIDAAVDFLGRSYAHQKNLNDIVEEFNACKGTRYSKDVVELLEDQSIFTKVESFLEEERPNIVFEAFVKL